MTNCHICDQLAAELGEILIKREKLAEARARRPKDPVTTVEDQQTDAELNTARQRLIDHRRLIHASH